MGAPTGRLLLGVLLFSAVAASAFHLSLGALLPSERDYLALSKRLRAESRPGDGVLVLPGWAERLRLYVDPSIPVHALPPDDPDLAEHDRLWVVTLPFAPGYDPEADLAVLVARFGRPALVSDTSPLMLLRFDGTRQQAFVRLADRLASAQVSLAGRPCAWQPDHRAGPRFQCQQGGWNYVADETREIDYLPRRCMWAHPVRNKPLSIRFPDVPPGSWLEVRGGIVGRAAFEENRGTVQIRLGLNGADLGSVAFPPRPGLVTRRFDLPGWTGPAAIELTVTAEDDGMRHLCFDVRIGTP